MKINNSFYKKLVASVAIVFSLLSIVEGSKVLSGIKIPEYLVFTPLLIYNIFMGVVGFITGFLLWLNYKKIVMLVKIILGAHIIVLLIIGILFLTSNVTAFQSLQAMIIRVIIWLIIFLVTLRADKPKEDYIISRS